jgi:hypothetical protein
MPLSRPRGHAADSALIWPMSAPLNEPWFSADTSEMAPSRRPTQTPTPNPVGRQDTEVLIGWVASLEGELMGDGVSEALERKLRRRLVDADLLGEGADERELRQATNDLNHRLRYALGGYAEPPASIPVPD